MNIGQEKEKDQVDVEGKGRAKEMADEERGKEERNDWVKSMRKDKKAWPRVTKIVEFLKYDPLIRER